MSEFLKDSGHRWMRTCNSCDGAFYCADGPEDEDEDNAAPDWMCGTCTAKDAEISRLRAALKPFADMARRGTDAHDADPVDATMGDCRAALKALGEEG